MKVLRNKWRPKLPEHTQKLLNVYFLRATEKYYLLTIIFRLNSGLKFTLYIYLLNLWCTFINHNDLN